MNNANMRALDNLKKLVGYIEKGQLVVSEATVWMGVSGETLASGQCTFEVLINGTRVPPDQTVPLASVAEAAAHGS